MAKTTSGILGAYRAMSSNMLECRAMLQADAPAVEAFSAYEFDEEQRREASE
jgi:hypothetical protein